MSSIKTQIENIKTRLNLSEEKHITVTGNSFLVHDSKEQPYNPSATGIAFHNNDNFIRLIIGPYGSGKSTICCAEIIFRSIAIPPCQDGVRRSRWAIVRNTYGDLEATSLKTWLEWFEELGMVHRRLAPRLQYRHEFYDDKGKIELELMFIALDRPDHIRKLKSLELTGVYLNEMSEIPPQALIHFKARVNRYPAQRDCTGDYWSGIIADTNPPDTDHWIYELFEVTHPEGHFIFHQPPALLKTVDGYKENPEADNLEHLKNGSEYYFNMMMGQSEEFIKVYVLGQYGTVVEGKFVYTNYNDDLHSVESIDIYDDETILLAWDFGIVCPACLACQYIAGQLYVIKEFIGEYITVKELYETSVLPFLTQYCQGLPIEALGDPANTYNGIEQLEELGLPVDKAKTNHLEPRISSVRNFLSRLVDGKPAILISRAHCTKLRQGFNGKYCYRRLRVVGEERYQDVPDKTHPHSDIHDCLQYAAMHYNSFTVEVDEAYNYPFEDDRGKSKVGGY
jgi:hypothetical protein